MRGDGGHGKAALLHAYCTSSLHGWRNQLEPHCLPLAKAGIRLARGTKFLSVEKFGCTKLGVMPSVALYAG